MENFYYELFFKVEERYKDLFFDFAFDLGIEAIEEKNGGAYLRSSEDLSKLSWALDLLAQRLPGSKILEKTLVKKENQDWMENYKKSIQPVSIDGIYIHTTWQKPKRKHINVKIDPALAFGSGHHESTYSCIKLLQRFAKKDTEALDLGCGSGILSIILAKLGCRVDACDTDKQAVDSTLANFKLNQARFHNIWQGSLEKATNTYELIVANLVADLILSLQKELKKHLKENAILILSGILNKYRTRIEERFQDLELIDSLKLNEWTSLVYQKRKNDEY